MKNKPRLYFAYWRRKETPENPGRYHVGLILSPKYPRNEQGEAVIYHAINTIDPKTKKEIWIFDDRPSETRTTKLAGVMLLGKVPPGFETKTVTEILRKVHVPTLEEANATGWRCRHWVLDALQLLANEGAIPPLPCSPQDLWKVGLDFVESKTQANEGFAYARERIPTCDMSGKESQSEIGPLA